jgi:hypothetical protein
MISPPQVSPAGPQWMFCWAQVCGQQPNICGPQWPGISLQKPPQSWFGPQVPQSSVPPQPSLAGPHSIPCCAQVSGCAHAPQTPGMAAPHTWPWGQLPHWSMPQQPSGAGPQSIARSAQVLGVHGGAPQTPV